MRSPLSHAVRGWLAAAVSAASAVAFVASGCGDARNPVAPADAQGDPAAARSDTGSAGGISVALLPPLAPARTSYPGAFDATRAAVVDVCAWNGSACVGNPVAHYDTRTTKPAITVSGAGQFYRVDWPTAGVTAGQVYRITISDGRTPLAYADAEQPGSGQTAAGLAAANIVPLGNASVLPIRFRMDRAQGVSAPAVTITAPAADSQYVPSGAPTTLSGTATDSVDGDISARIVWTSTLGTAPLGTGATISVTLPAGPQTITASATNSRGGTGTSTRYLTASLLASAGSITVPYGGTASLPITIATPAPSGGITITVVSADTTLVKVTTPTVTIPAGSRSVNATLAGVGVGSANVSATSATYGRAVTRANVSADLRFADRSASFPASRTQTITIGLQSAGSSIAAPAGGFAVGLRSTDSGCVRVPASVTIPAGLVNATVTLAYGGTTATPCNASLVAYGATNPAVTRDSIPVSIANAPTFSFSTLPQYVGAGLRNGSYSYIQLGSPAPNGGVAVTIRASDSTRLLVAPATSTATVGHGTATVIVPAGQSTATFYVDGVEGAGGSTATLTAAASGYTSATTSAISVTRLGVGVAGLPATTTTLTPATTFYAYVGPTYTSNGYTYLAGAQPVRPGGHAITVTFASSQANVARLKTNATTAQSVTAVIAAGQQNTPTNLPSGGVAFQPLSGGSTTVSANVPGAVAVANSAQTVTVTGAGITFVYVPQYLGAGLRSSSFVYAQLGAPAPVGGATVTIRASDSTRLLVAPATSTATVGHGTATVIVAAGQSTATFYVDGVESAAGNSATVTASAPGYATGTTTAIGVTRPGLAIAGLPATTTTLTPATAFYAYVGPTYTTGGNTYLAGAQPVRPGGHPITVTFASSQASVGQLKTSSTTARTATATIAVGQQNTPTDLPSGGVAFQPTGGGSTTVSVRAPGAATVSTSVQSVSVTGAGITFGTLPQYLGAGLRSSQAYAYLYLGAPAPAGGVTVTIAASDSTKLLVSPAVTPGAPAVVGHGSAVVAVPAGYTYAQFSVDALEGAAGSTAAVTASAPGYTTGTSAPIAVTRPGLSLQGLSATTTTLTPATSMYANVGATYTSGGITYVTGGEAVRPGGHPITVTFTNGQAGVAQLRTVSRTAQSVTAVIPAGQYSTSTDSASGGVFFVPLSAGTTTVTASAPGVTAVNASQVVTVSAPALAFNRAPQYVGAGLRYGYFYVQLGAPAPAGGLDITVKTSSASTLLVAPETGQAATVGSATTTLHVDARSSNGFLDVDGVENASGTVTITASAPGYTNATTSISVTPVGAALGGLPSSLATSASPSAIYASVGPVYTSGGVTYFGGAQTVRPGGHPITLAFTNSQSSVGQLSTSAGTGQRETAVVAIGEQNTPTDVTSGGVAFQPLGAGTTTVNVGGSGIAANAQSSQAVTVSATAPSVARASARAPR